MLQEIVVNIMFTQIKTKVTVNVIDQKIDSSIFKEICLMLFNTLLNIVCAFFRL